MTRRQEGFTLIEILVVITIIAALVGLVTLLIPQGAKEREKVVCMKNLKEIGGMLKLRETGGKSITNHSGAAFLLQISEKVSDDNLKVFMCPGDPGAEGRPEVGSEDFVSMYRKNTKNLGSLSEADLRRMSSYAGPNWKDHPRNRASTETRVWGCDACAGRNPHHQGIVLLYDSTKVDFVEIGDLEGQDENSIYVGPGSGDERLATMIFLPKQTR